MSYDKELTMRLLSAPLTNESIELLIGLNIGLVNKQLNAFSLTDNHDALSFAIDGLYKAILNYNGSASFSTFATVCIRNSIRQAIRSNKSKLHTVPIDEISSSMVAQAQCLLDPFAQDRYEVLVFLVEELIQAETASVQRVLRFWFDSDCTLLNKEIACSLNVSQPYVNKIINNFRRKLEIKLKEGQNG